MKKILAVLLTLGSLSVGATPQAPDYTPATDQRDTVPKVLVDNDRIKITEYISQPGEDVCGKGRHTHQDHATILLTDAKVRATKEDGSIQVETYSAGQQLYVVDSKGKTEKMSTDGVFWAKGATHSVTNIGDKPIRFYIIETP